MALSPLLLALVFLGGVLTIISPCILPVLPFVFARTGRPFATSGLPMLVGMALTFAAVATLAAAGGGWAVQANEVGRGLAMLLLAVFGLGLVFSNLATRLARPLVQLGGRLSQTAHNSNPGGNVIAASLILGVATGLLWAPCAGPILGLILTGAALRGASLETSALLAAYAAGAATSLAIGLLLGGRLVRTLAFGEWARRCVGALVVVAVAAIALGLDTSVLAQVSLASTTSLEQGLLNGVEPTAAGPAQPLATPPPAAAAPTAPLAAVPTPNTVLLPVEDEIPSLNGAVQWLNSPPLTADELKGKVVVVDFWTYSCINCLRELPYVQAWADKYRDQGLVVIGVHSPEFAFEKNPDNVQKAVSDLKITFPVAIDSNYALWRAFDNEYWPAEYFIDAQGRIRHHVFGEGDYADSEADIQQLLAEAGQTNLPSGVGEIQATGVQAAPDIGDVKSPETYLGFTRAQDFVSPGGLVRGRPGTYAPGSPRLNEWGLGGNWTVNAENASLNGAGGSIVFRFHARDLHLVLGPASGGTPVRFQVTLDGAPPGANHGFDTDETGQGTITEERLYQLVRQSGSVADHTFQITFKDPGVQAYSFTFG